MVDNKILARIKNDNSRRSLLFIGMAAITLAIFYVLLSLVDVEKVVAELTSINIGYLLAILILEGPYSCWWHGDTRRYWAIWEAVYHIVDVWP